TVVPGRRAAPPSATARARWFERLREPGTLARLAIRSDHLQGTRSWPLREGVPDLVDLQASPPPREALAARVAALPPLQAAALLALRDRLFLPERSERDQFDLTQREQRRGFWPNEQLLPRGEGFCWRASGDDPWLVTPCLQRRVRTVELDLRVHAPGL